MIWFDMIWYDVILYTDECKNLHTYWTRIGQKYSFVAAKKLCLSFYKNIHILYIKILVVANPLTFC